jgi:hypothetical protein
MLTAMHPRDRKKVVLLREDGLAWAEHLREEAREGHLVCEGCSQPVVVRAGEERLWHFAHKAGSDCPRSKDPMEILECRVLLYGWLRQRFPDSIQAEKAISQFPRPLDCWVERPGKPTLAWSVVPAAVKPDVREAMLKACRKLGVLLHRVFHARLLVKEPGQGRITLSATLRELTERSAYDGLYGFGDESLHFLDPARRQLTTCRGIWLRHPPQGHQATLLEHPLESILLHPRTGEFVHPGEHEAWKAHLEVLANQRRAEEERKRHQASISPEDYRRRRWESREDEDDDEEEPEEEENACELTQPVISGARVPDGGPVTSASDPGDRPTLAEPEAESLLTCKDCGNRTRDWVVRYGSSGFCRCRACTR